MNHLQAKPLPQNTATNPRPWHSHSFTRQPQGSALLDRSVSPSRVMNVAQTLPVQSVTELLHACDALLHRMKVGIAERNILRQSANEKALRTTLVSGRAL